MQRFRQRQDKEVFEGIRNLQMDVLIELFERNYVNVKNHLEQKGGSDPQIIRSLMEACTVVWDFFGNHTWRESSHKIDFMVTYALHCIWNTRYSELKVKLRHNFPELDLSIQRLFDEEDRDINLLRETIKYLKPDQRDLISIFHFEGFDFNQITNLSHFDHEDDAENAYLNALIRLAKMLKGNFNDRFDSILKRETLEKFVTYYSRYSREEERLQIELENTIGEKNYIRNWEFLVNGIRSYRRYELIQFLKKNSSTRLTGNIWGNRWSIGSGLFILLTGLAIVYAHFNPPEKNRLPNTVDSIEQSVDTLNTPRQ